MGATRSRPVRPVGVPPALSNFPTNSHLSPRNMSPLLPSSGFAAALAGICLSLALPAAAQVVVVGSTVQEKHLAVGGTESGTIRLRNTSTVAQEVRVYQADYSFLASGENHFPEPGSHPRSNATWISFTPSQLVLAPREEASVGYTMTAPVFAPAPAGPPPQGTYWSVLLVEGVEAAPADAELSKGQIGIRPQIRFAVQLATHIETSGTRDVELGEVRMTTAPSGERTFSIDVVHAGERAYRPEIRLHLYSEEGELVEDFVEKRGLLYPGTGLRQHFDVSNVPAGTYELLITVDTGGPDLFGAQIRATF